MKFGLSDLEYNYIAKTVVAPFKEKQVDVYCFGSRARGDNKKFSDLDLLIEASRKNFEVIYSHIKEKLENENFPYRVDIVFKDEVAVSYANQIHKEKKPFF